MELLMALFLEFISPDINFIRSGRPLQAESTSNPTTINDFLKEILNQNEISSANYEEYPLNKLSETERNLLIIAVDKPFSFKLENYNNDEMKNVYFIMAREKINGGKIYLEKVAEQKIYNSFERKTPTLLSFEDINKDGNYEAFILMDIIGSAGFSDERIFALDYNKKEIKNLASFLVGATATHGFSYHLRDINNDRVKEIITSSFEAYSQEPQQPKEYNQEIIENTLYTYGVYLWSGEEYLINKELTKEYTKSNSKPY